MPGDFTSRTKKSETKCVGGGGFYTLSTYLAPNISHPPVSLLVHPRRPLIEPETAQLLCRPSALLAGSRGAVRPAASGTKGGTKDPLCFSPAPAEPQDPASPVTVPQGFPAQPTEPRGKCSTRITCQAWRGGCPLGLRVTTASPSSSQPPKHQVPGGVV